MCGVVRAVQMVKHVTMLGSLLVAAMLQGCGAELSSDMLHENQQPLRVAAASDLAFAFDEIQLLHYQMHQRKVDVILGSTGLLARQIQQGAPFDLFFAANISFVDDLIEAGAARPETKSLYALGRIVIWQRADAEKPVTNLAALLSAGIETIAIANPDHAPYGLAAKQALIHAGIWDELAPKIVYGENVNQAYQFVRSGNADVGIIALSLAIAVEGGDWTLVPESFHEPIVQAAVVTQVTDDLEGAKAFLQTIESAKGREIMRRYGFLLPGEFTVEE